MNRIAILLSGQALFESMVMRDQKKKKSRCALVRGSHAWNAKMASVMERAEIPAATKGPQEGAKIRTPDLGCYTDAP